MACRPGRRGYATGRDGAGVLGRGGRTDRLRRRHGDGEDDDTAAAGSKVSANTASEEEIAAALDSAGVSNADRWAEEVVEYRPYPAEDANLTKLRDNLVKYNPGQETTDKIVSALTP